MKRAPAKWVADNPAAYDNGIRSFWLNAFVSQWATWKSIVLKFLEAIGDTAKMQVVYNTCFGKLWENRGDIQDEDTLLGRREEYEAELPDGVLVLTAGIDTQDDRMEYEIKGHGHFNETWGIEKGIVMGRPDDDATWEQLDNLVFNRYFQFKDGIKLRVSMSFVDEGGHFTQEVRQRCRERIGRKVFCIKGFAGPDRPYTGPPKQVKIVVNGTHVGTCWQYQIGVDAGKQIIMDNLRVGTVGPKYCHFPKRDDYGIGEEIVPRANFFRDRYFPTDAGDLFASDKVLTEYRKGDRKMASFVSPRVGDIPMDRRGYEIHEYQPARIAPSRVLTADELNKRGFGEALYSQSTEAQRAARLLQGDLRDMDLRIERREEWMCAKTMIDNGCTMQEYLDDKTKGDTLIVKFYDTATEHKYTPAKKWNASGATYADFKNDVIAACRLLTRRGLPAEDMLIGADVNSWLQSNTEFQKLLDRNSGILTGTVNEQLTRYPGVTYIGRFNFGGHNLDLFCVDEEYEDENGQSAKLFPATSVEITAPSCGHLMYGQITQMDYGQTDFTSYVAKRVPKLIVDQPNDLRKLRYSCRPLAAPKNYTPWIYMESVIG